MELVDTVKQWTGEDRRRSKVVLYLDDCEDQLQLFRIQADALGFITTTVKYPSDFIKEYESGRYDIAFVDFLLSSVDGVTLTRLLHKEKAPHTKLYIFTAFDIELVRRKVNGDKINGVLSKMDGVSKILAEVVHD
jgi:CheY-like chemotaxis protein